MAAKQPLRSLVPRLSSCGYTLLVRINVQFVLLRDTVENTAIAIVQNLLDQAAEFTYLALFPVSTPSFFFRTE